MNLLRKFAPAAVIVGLLGAAPVAALADDNLQSATVYRYSDDTAVVGPTAVLDRSEHKLVVTIHTSQLKPNAAVTVRVFTYSNPAECSGNFAFNGAFCGGPSPADAPPGVICSIAPFDSCNPETGFKVTELGVLTTSDGAGNANLKFQIPNIKHSDRAEVQVYLKQEPIEFGSTTKQYAFFSSPSDEHGRQKGDKDD